MLICSGLTPPLLVIGLMQGAYATAADTLQLQRAVRFGGSSTVGLYNASQQPPQ